jgi:hypothetical protein
VLEEITPAPSCVVGVNGCWLAIGIGARVVVVVVVAAAHLVARTAGAVAMAYMT